MINSLLKKEGFPASLISDKQGFVLRDLLEIKSFTYYIFKDIQDDLVKQHEKWLSVPILGKILKYLTRDK